MSYLPSLNEILNGTTKLSQHDIIKKHLELHGNITSWEAITKYHVTRLSAIIFNLRSDGLNISTEMIQNKKKGSYIKRWAKYTLHHDYKLF